METRQEEGELRGRGTPRPCQEGERSPPSRAGERQEDQDGGGDRADGARHDEDAAATPGEVRRHLAERSDEARRHRHGGIADPCRDRRAQSVERRRDAWRLPRDERVEDRPGAPAEIDPVDDRLFEEVGAVDEERPDREEVVARRDAGGVEAVARPPRIPRIDPNHAGDDGGHRPATFQLRANRAPVPGPDPERGGRALGDDRLERG